MAEGSVHRWQFARLGGFDQVRLETAADLVHLPELDLKLWAALACPVKGLEFDERTLSLIDTDKDGRVRAPEVVEAVRWCASILKDPADLKAGKDAVPLDRIADGTEAGRAILASARQILKDLGKPGTAIALADVSDTARLFSLTRLNGDGIVPAEAAADEATRKLVQDVIACVGSVPDRSGKPGIDKARLDAFFAEAAAEVGWAGNADGDAAVRPLGDGTAAAHAAWAAVRAKVDDWFSRGRMAAFDARALGALNRREEEYLDIAAQDLSVSAQEVAGFPLARVVAGGALPLTEGVNPAWAAALETLRTAAVEPLIGKGKTSLTAAEWKELSAKLAGHDGWLAARPGTRVQGLGVPRLKEILAAGQQPVAALIEADLAREPEYRAIEQVERLVRYHRDLYRLLCNFVNFSDFYSADRWAVFQAGTLYLDARSCELCVRVDDAGKHGLLAGHSKTYLAYLDCTRPSGERLSIAAGFTDGDSDYMLVGRNGVFFDRRGRDWDATIARLVENPISVRQAFWTPYKKLVRFIDEMFSKRAAAAEVESDKKLVAAAEQTAAAPPATPTTVPPPAPAPAPPARKIDVGTVAAISVAIAGIGALLTTLIGYVAGLFTLPFWILCLALAGILLVISGPSMLIAWLKLRQRNLGPILDANGWAVNGRVKMNVRFGKSLTQVATLPPGSTPGADPFGEKPSPWPRLLLAAVIISFVYSFLSSHYWLNDWTRPGTWWHERVGFSMGEERPPEVVPVAAEPAPAEPAPAKPASDEAKPEPK